MDVIAERMIAERAITPERAAALLAEMRSV
jgi:hypothetical protein